MISLRNVTKQFNGTTVLENLSLEIADESRLCIVGGSGVGKSVLAKLILGLLPLDKGEIWIDTVPIAGLGPKGWARILEQFGVVFQSSALFDSLTIRENVGLKLYEAHQEPQEVIKARVIEALARVQLHADILERFPAELSGGMRKRVGISRAIIHSPRYLIYDEPTAGLDPVSAAAIDQLIGDLAAEPDRTSVIITHDLETIRSVATEVAMIFGKKVGFQGSLEAFLGSEVPEVQAFLGRGESGS